MLLLQKRLITATILGAALLSACGNNNDNKDVAENSGIYKQNGNTINRQNEEDLYNPEKVNTPNERSSEFGYVRQVKSPVPNKAVNFKQDNTFDREKVADTISKIAITLPKVHDASSLVTDEEVLIAYRTDVKDKEGRNDIADQVKKTALSVVPRWYHVYVTDDPSLRQDIENIAYMNGASGNHENAINGVIKRMLSRSPQGSKLNNGENENGEAMTDDKEYMNDNDKYRNQYKKGGS